MAAEVLGGHRNGASWQTVHQECFWTSGSTVNEFTHAYSGLLGQMLFLPYSS